MKFDDFTQGYLEALLFFEEPEELDQSWFIEDIEAQSLQQIIEDCRKFQKDNSELLIEYYEKIITINSTPEEYAGHDFYLTRQHHGAGFWDRGLGYLGKELAKASQVFKELCVEQGDNGKIYVF
jgi:hypothetical protein